MRISLCASVAIVCCALIGSHAQATAWPTEKPIRLVVGYPPGGGADAMARLLSPLLSQELGQRVVVDNRSGAGGRIAADLVAKSEPDGYTLLLDASSFAINPALYKRLPYDPIGSFAPVSLIALFPNVLVVNPSFAATSVRDVVSLARKEPGRVAYASGGNGTAQHLAGAMFAQSMGVDLLHVPYKGGGPALADVIAGQVPVFFANTASALPHIRAGKLRALAVTGDKRVAVLPGTPTMAEEGVTRYEVYEWNSVFVPAGTPAQIVQRLSDAIRKAMSESESRERVSSLGGTVVAGTPSEASKFIKGQMTEWERVISSGRIQAD
ncbi:tripartite tricarboxylate transporter substrate binding protein [Cupriavidus basilensis]|nr:tripartite tricarboxylate transporter substrate binding protein [Cupriavidus basilensis]